MTRRTGSYTTSDLSRKSGDIIAEALRHPVTITLRNKPRLVLLNIEGHERLLLESDARTSGTIDTCPTPCWPNLKPPSMPMPTTTRPDGERLRRYPDRSRHPLSLSLEPRSRQRRNRGERPVAVGVQIPKPDGDLVLLPNHHEAAGATALRR
ncbi:hypothetical protein J2W42_005271 [Rhizobium tibeticum]|nr:hypothetical protein [Rhizobium tibeticum]